VLGKGGRLTGYAGGLKRKQRLLELEEPAETKAGRLF
jgi:methylated-DNA-[protein]-cysteine S-methyltransferase